MALVFLLYVVAEVAAVWAVGSAIGLLPTLGLLVAGAVLGSWLARREGGKAARAFMDTARAGKPAHNEVTDGMLIALGGLLILLPGFVSDLAGLLLLLPTRALFRRAWLRRLERQAPMMQHGGIGPMGSMGSMGAQNPFGPPGQDRADQDRVIVVDSEIVEDDRPERPRPDPAQRPVIDQP
ncbi:hypothetical protein CFN78_14435 [Amycolatopsis antarctica]|uniref:Exlusion protein FxsA n=1 Tax=Amycolatopsis antarctica TaxID=1854586 RepID=A0A263D5Q3_9PSEU|nr:FxsA family protein [Amycolatopsis antarctica]OZM72806.1 hypothetical protein CFN78_14435 [Amycolatopsis antarctica]